MGVRPVSLAPYSAATGPESRTRHTDRRSGRPVGPQPSAGTLTLTINYRMELVGGQ